MKLNITLKILAALTMFYMIGDVYRTFPADGMYRFWWEGIIAIFLILQIRVKKE